MTTCRICGAEIRLQEGLWVDQTYDAPSTSIEVAALCMKGRGNSYHRPAKEYDAEQKLAAISVILDDVTNKIPTVDLDVPWDALAEIRKVLR